ncbi:hypothetical protein PABG_12404 [Paracoccidioides brasiliensis Pb03]|nr:hypothetical protein PABG_12404 [Paracoccidioides brasiliensis Pb03]
MQKRNKHQATHYHPAVPLEPSRLAYDFGRHGPILDAFWMVSREKGLALSPKFGIRKEESSPEPFGRAKLWPVEMDCAGLSPVGHISALGGG